MEGRRGRRVAAERSAVMSWLLVAWRYARAERSWVLVSAGAYGNYLLLSFLHATHVSDMGPG